jgi:hypothetical protein
MRVFSPCDESYSDATERATRWAHRQDIKAGDQSVVGFYGDFYLIEKFDSADLKYQIAGKITEKEYNYYIKEYQNNGENFSRQSSEESLNTISALDRERNWAGGGEYSSNSSSVGQREKDFQVRKNVGDEFKRREDTSNGSGSLQGGGNGVERARQLNSHLSIKQTFIDVSGKRRNVLGIGDGKYTVQDTKRHNYKFNSIEDAIAAENENIIQRYGNNFESEVLFSRKAKYIIDNITYDADGNPTIYLTEVSDGQARITTGKIEGNI